MHISRSIYVTYTHKVWIPSPSICPMNPLNPIRTVLPSNKTFSFFFWRVSGWFLKPLAPFPTPIKWKEYQLDPLGAASAISLRGIKQFQDFFLRVSRWFLKPPAALPTPIIWKVKTIEPLGSCFSSLPPGDKTIPGFLFDAYPGGFWNPQHLFLRQ